MDDTDRQNSSGVSSGALTGDARVWRRVINGLLATAVAVLFVSALWVSQQALSTLDRVLVPEFDRDAETIATAVGTEIERARELGVPFADMRGMRPFLEDHIERNSAVAYIATTDAQGRIIYSAGERLNELERRMDAGSLTPLSAAPVIVDLETVRNASFPLWVDAERQTAFARLQVGMNRAYAEQQIADVRWDILIVLIVSLLITFELLVFVVDRNILTPLRLIDRTVRDAAQGTWTVRPGTVSRRDEIGRVLGALDELSLRISQSYRRIDASISGMREVPAHISERLDGLRRTVRLGFDDARAATLPARVDARLPLFVFVFAEELSRAFLPLYAMALYRDPLVDTSALNALPVSADVVVALPIVVFMAFVALATPLGGTLVARYGARRIFIAGAIPAIVGYLGTAAAASAYDLLIWRTLSAIGYAIVTIAAQGYIGATAEPGQRARAMATFVGAVTTAVICGSSIGAVLADRLGYRATFLISAALVIAAALIAARFMQTMPAEALGRRARLTAVMRTFGNLRFSALVVFAAVPAKIALTGFLFFLTPLYLHQLGVSEPAIGRTIMLYGIFMLVGTQLGAIVADRRGAYALLIALGGLITGAALYGGTLLSPTVGVPLAVAVFGLAQGIASAPMLAILPQLCPSEAERYGSTSLVGLLRLSERVGSVVGPLLATSLIATGGYSYAIVTIGAVSAGAALIFYGIVARASSAGRTRGSEAHT